MAINWKDPAEIARDGLIFERLIHVLLGLYIWEFCSSLGFDLDYLKGKRKIKWSHVPYFLNRYLLLIALIGIAVSLNVTTRVNCQVLYTFNQVLGNAAVGLASINLSLRTMAIYAQSWEVVVPLCVLIVGHWAILLHGVLLTAEWVGGTCVIVKTNNTILAAGFVYSMAFDFIVMILMAHKLSYQSWRGTTSVIRRVFRDGLIFFIIAFLANLIATTFMLLNLNPVMSIVANVPAAIASTIVACRCFRRLIHLADEKPSTFSSSQSGPHSGIRFKNDSNSTSGTNVRPGGDSKLNFAISIEKTVHSDQDMAMSVENLKMAPSSTFSSEPEAIEYPPPLHAKATKESAYSPV